MLNYCIYNPFSAWSHIVLICSIIFNWHMMISHLSCVQLFVILWTVARQVPLSMEFSRQEYWSGLPYTSPGVLSNPEIKHVSLCLLYWQVTFLPLTPPGKPCWLISCIFINVKIIYTACYFISFMSFSESLIYNFKTQQICVRELMHNKNFGSWLRWSNRD